jgi:hypothetical protein
VDVSIDHDLGDLADGRFGRDGDGSCGHVVAHDAAARALEIDDFAPGGNEADVGLLLDGIVSAPKVRDEIGRREDTDAIPFAIDDWRSADGLLHE